jgi:hypothetical protein
MDTQLVGLAFSPAIKTSICPEILSVAARMKQGRMPASLARSPRLRVCDGVRDRPEKMDSQIGRGGGVEAGHGEDKAWAQRRSGWLSVQQRCLQSRWPGAGFTN